MTATWRLAWRLAGSGGQARQRSIVAGTAIGVFLVLVVLAIPHAIFPGGNIEDYQRNALALAGAFILAPVAVLLLTVGRLSSATRDRRLASLRMLGMRQGRVRWIAALENVLLAAPGALIGAALFAIGAPAINHLTRRDLPGELTATPSGYALSAVAVIVLSALIAAGSVPNGDARAARSEATRRSPGLWRLAPPVVAALVMWWQMTLDPERTQSLVFGLSVYGGALLAAVGIALVVPLLASWVSRLLAAGGHPARLLGARAIQVEPAGLGRLVAGIGVTVFLVAASGGLIGVLQNDSDYQMGARSVGAGPQVIWADGLVSADGSERAPLTDADRAALAAVPGVQGVIPIYAVQDARCSRDGEVDFTYCGNVFIGTCAQLDLRMVSTGCRDDQAAIIRSEEDGDALGPPDERSVPLVAYDFDGEQGPTVEVALREAPIVQDANATLTEWPAGSDYAYFIPAAACPELTAQYRHAEVVAVGGTEVQRAVNAVAEVRGFTTQPYFLDGYRRIQQITMGVLTIAGIAVGVGLLGLALGTIDRAIERRRSVARQIAIGVPGRVLRAAQAWQTALPLAATVLVATGLGAIQVAVWRELGDSAQAGVPTTMWVFGIGVVVAGAMVCLVSAAAVRTRLSPELLRRE